MTTRKPAVAGMFYPAPEIDLRKAVQDFLQYVPKQEQANTLKAIIVPHAGYGYSGQVAAFAFAQLQKWDAARAEQSPARVILLGPAHTVSVSEITADANRYWETPLGLVETFSHSFPRFATPHQMEHCLEVQVPFLQETLSDFQILPLVVGSGNAKRDADQIIKVLDNDTILVISTDLSHYNDYETAKRLDMATIEAIESLDIQKFKRVGVACGKYPIQVSMYIARHLSWKCHLLNYRNSGDVSGKNDSVVGYAAFEFMAKKSPVFCNKL